MSDSEKSAQANTFDQKAALRVERLRDATEITSMLVPISVDDVPGPGRKLLTPIQRTLQSHIALTYRGLQVALRASGIPEVNVHDWIAERQNRSLGSVATLKRVARESIAEFTPFRSEKAFNDHHRARGAGLAFDALDVDPWVREQLTVLRVLNVAAARATLSIAGRREHFRQQAAGQQPRAPGHSRQSATERRLFGTPSEQERLQLTPNEKLVLAFCGHVNAADLWEEVEYLRLLFEVAVHAGHLTSGFGTYIRRAALEALRSRLEGKAEELPSADLAHEPGLVDAWDKVILAMANGLKVPQGSRPILLSTVETLLGEEGDAFLLAPGCLGSS